MRKEIVLDDVDWVSIQQHYDTQGLIISDVMEILGCNEYKIRKATMCGLFTPRKTHVSQTRTKISKERIHYLKENPDLHPWKKKNKNKSHPCELFKSALLKHDICFIEEFSPLDDRMFSIDVAFPDIKIGIEINGNQHYNSDGSLRPYYQERHELIENAGWTLYEYHFSICFDSVGVDALISSLQNDNLLPSHTTENVIEYQRIVDVAIKKRKEKKKPKKKRIYVYRKRQKTGKCIECGGSMHSTSNCCIDCSNMKRRSTNKELCCIDCGILVTGKSKRCRDCSNIFKIGQYRKVERPSYAQLLSEICDSSYCEVGRKYGVSDNAIRKWVKQYEKELP
jgi:hypothetical protein